MSKYNILGYIPNSSERPTKASEIYLNGDGRVHIKRPDQTIINHSIEELPQLLGDMGVIFEDRGYLSSEYSTLIDHKGRVRRTPGNSDFFLSILEMKKLEQPSRLEKSTILI